MSVIQLPFLFSKKYLSSYSVCCKIGFYSLILCLLNSCVSTRNSISPSKTPSLTLSKDFDTHFTGLLIFDPVSKDTIFSKNAQKYFTPASTVKIFTLYTALKLLPENVPTLRYLHKRDTLFIAGTGDPSILHPYFNDSTAITFLRQQQLPIAVNLANYEESAFGPGWAWEDYDASFSAERTSFPLYGNTVQISKPSILQVTPSQFKKDVFQQKSLKKRALRTNQFYVDSLLKDTISIPFITSSNLTQTLLEEVLLKKIHIIPQLPVGERKTLFGISSDSLYRRMMFESDNFIAEQLLLVGSSVLSDTLSGASSMHHVMKHHLSSIRQKPRWVDGSGLSRYNLFSPESMIQVLHNLYIDLPRKKLLSLFPAGGVSGTLKDSFSGENRPYIYAKSGSLGNNFCLSGYLITKSNKILLFSFMNNHFRRSSKDIKIQMNHFLQKVRNTY